MSYTAMQREVVNYCDKNDFISNEIIEHFKQKLKQEDNVHTLIYALSKFVGGSCPKCGESGSFKWHFLGKLVHPKCGLTWYINPGAYIAAQLTAVFRTGVEIGVDAAEPDKKGEGGGFIGGVFGFLMGVSIRLPFALLMIPIQAIVSLTQAKPDQTMPEKG